MASWGIAWYLEDLLIPVVEMVRGTTYTFTISGGNTPDSNSEYHPFYLSTSSVGGYVQLSPSERAQQKVLAGINVTERDSSGGVTKFVSTLEAPICLYKATNVTAAALSGDYQKFFGSLDTSCQNNVTITKGAAVLTFTPDKTTPDEIYYQCVTHRNLGWKINVVDAASCNNCGGLLFSGVSMRRKLLGGCRQVCTASFLVFFRKLLGFDCGKCP